MKKQILMLALAISGLSIAVDAQHLHGIGMHFGAYDFYGPQTGDYITSDRRTSEYNDVRRTYDTAHHKKFYWRPMAKVSYWWQCTRNFDVTAALSFASLEYPTSNDDTAYVNKYRLETGDRRERILSEFDLRFNYNILPRDKWIVSPYVFAGVNASYHDIFFGADIPLGAGLNVALDKARDLSLNLE